MKNYKKLEEKYNFVKLYKNSIDSEKIYNSKIEKYKIEENFYKYTVIVFLVGMILGMLIK
jgi:hypothetical protein